MPACPSCKETYTGDLNYCGRCGSDIRSQTAGAQDDPWLGTIVDGRYRVIHKIGAGGMSSVYRVEHLAIAKVAAMKVLHREIANEPDALKRFRREAEAISRLGHPNTVQVFDFGQTGTSTYLIMEYVRGEDLGTILRRDGHITFARAAPIVLQICGSLGEAHDLGIVHRDVKPENVIVSRTKEGSDFVKVLDFGLAKITLPGGAAGASNPGILIGTPYYMSPEQIRADREPDARSDVYSLGAVMYRILCGAPPFEAATPVAVLTKHLTEEPAPLLRPGVDVPPAVAAIVLRALAKDPEDRFASMDELREALADAAGDLVPRSPATGPRRRRSDPGFAASDLPSVNESVSISDRLSRSDLDQYEHTLRRQKYLRLSTLPLALVLVAGVGITWSRNQRQRAQDHEQEPNNTPEQANLLPDSGVMHGHLAQRLSRDQGDVDVFKLATAPGPRVLRAEVTGLPNLDLVLEVFDGSGQMLGRADSRGQGEGELIANLRVQKGELYLVVREARAPGRIPTENLTDEYTLSAQLHEASADEEVEPNDDAQGQPLAPGTAVVGFLDHRADVDPFRVDAAAGEHKRAVLTYPAGLKLRVRIGDHETVAGPSPWHFDVAGGQTVRLVRVDPPQRGENKPPLHALDQPYRIEILP
jgi:serine/threonine-protein kinase